ncbi:hypothetical protein EVAR_27332_1 [Eumeta japonica]|uniref:Uncharacterized protein n=1 Tax=Eumeta variegata TaxID=151549 RepID=A0A4C1UCK8_EUMVA|nr:hypothetical protein EVAR_27332_1 [Eumeta japonica]
MLCKCTAFQSLVNTNRRLRIQILDIHFSGGRQHKAVTRATGSKYERSQTVLTLALTNGVLTVLAALAEPIFELTVEDTKRKMNDDSTKLDSTELDLPEAAGKK